MSARPVDYQDCFPPVNRNKNGQTYLQELLSRFGVGIEDLRRALAVIHDAGPKGVGHHHSGLSGPIEVLVHLRLVVVACYGEELRFFGSDFAGDFVVIREGGLSMVSSPLHMALGELDELFRLCWFPELLDVEVFDAAALVSPSSKPLPREAVVAASWVRLNGEVDAYWLADVVVNILSTIYFRPRIHIDDLVEKFGFLPMAEVQMLLRTAQGTGLLTESRSFLMMKPFSL